jgi:hypothetical protein
MTSPDGITWTSRTSAANNNWQSVTYGNGLFVAVASSGTGNRVMTSPDGITWTSRVSAANQSWYSVTHAGGLFVSVSVTGSTTGVMTSGTFLSAPDAPAQPTVTAGNAEATITVAPGSGSTPASYTVTANPGGRTCTVTGASGTCTITGLTNDQEYTFTATATNTSGTSSPSPASRRVTPSAPRTAADTTTPATTTAATTSGASQQRTVTFKPTVSCNRTVACTTTGTVPTDATRVIQTATLSLLRGARLSTRVTTRCPITTRNAVRRYRCELRLGAGAWVITTKALNGSTVVAETVRRVKLSAPSAEPVTG